jgi:hypothetical protein
MTKLMPIRPRSDPLTPEEAQLVLFTGKAAEMGFPLLRGVRLSNLLGYEDARSVPSFSALLDGTAELDLSPQVKGFYTKASAALPPDTWLRAASLVMETMCKVVDTLPPEPHWADPVQGQAHNDFGEMTREYASELLHKIVRDGFMPSAATGHARDLYILAAHSCDPDKLSAEAREERNALLKLRSTIRRTSPHAKRGRLPIMMTPDEARAIVHELRINMGSMASAAQAAGYPNPQMIYSRLDAMGRPAWARKDAKAFIMNNGNQLIAKAEEPNQHVEWINPFGSPRESA